MEAQSTPELLSSLLKSLGSESRDTSSPKQYQVGGLLLMAEQQDKPVFNSSESDEELDNGVCLDNGDDADIDEGASGSSQVQFSCFSLT